MLQRVLASFLVVVIAACSALAPTPIPPRISVAAVEIKSFGLLEQRFDVALRVANPNGFELTVEALEFDLDVNGQRLASGLSPLPTRLGASSETAMRIEVVARSDDLIRQMRTLSRQLLEQGLPYRIRGRVKTDRSSRWLPFEHSGIYGAARPSDRGPAI